MWDGGDCSDMSSKRKAILAGGSTATCMLAAAAFVFVKRRRRARYLAKRYELDSHGQMQERADWESDLAPLIERVGRRQASAMHRSGLLQAFWGGGSSSRKKDSDALASVLPWVIDMDTLTIGEVAGVGSTGTVFRGVYCGQQVAIKRMVVSQWDEGKVAEFFKGEVVMLSRMQHPHVVRFFGCACSDSQLFIVTEFCEGSLASLIAAHSANPPGRLGRRSAGHSAGSSTGGRDIGAVPLPLFFKIASSIANGMAFLHSRDVLHRDLKPENVSHSV
jgi:serine/threonine protein kinase